MTFDMTFEMLFEKRQIPESIARLSRITAMPVTAKCRLSLRNADKVRVMVILVLDKVFVCVKMYSLARGPRTLMGHSGPHLLGVASEKMSPLPLSALLVSV
jgi:hypothetical protein